MGEWQGVDKMEWGQYCGVGLIPGGHYGCLVLPYYIEVFFETFYKTNASPKYEMIGINSIDIVCFLTTIWLPHGQLWTIIEGEASLIQC